MKKSSISDRHIELDYLRVFATFAVMILHIAATNWASTDVNGSVWQTLNFYDSIVRWSVPIFIMISGTLFLSREIPIKIIYSKYILRMFTAFLAWSCFYSLIMYIENNDRNSVIINVISGRYHMWFIFMIVGIYMCIPFIKILISKEELMKYFLILSFIFTFVIPQVMALLTDFASESVLKYANIVNLDVVLMNINFVKGYIFYFILGFYISSRELSKKQRICIYCAGIIGFVLTILLDLIVSLKTQTPCQTYYDYLSVNVFLESVSVFVFFKYHIFKHNKLNVLMVNLSKFSFGAYLVHVFVIDQLPKFGISSLMCKPIIAVPLMGIIVFIISFAISLVCNYIPVFKKYIV